MLITRLFTIAPSVNAWDYEGILISPRAKIGTLLRMTASASNTVPVSSLQTPECRAQSMTMPTKQRLLMKDRRP